MSNLVRIPEDRFSHDVAHLSHIINIERYLDSSGNAIRSSFKFIKKVLVTGSLPSDRLMCAKLLQRLF